MLILCTGSVLGVGNVGEITHFNIPEGKAVHTLRQAARQADVDIMFVSKIVRGAKTSALHGEYTVHDAIDLMLSETQLVVVRDNDTGAIAIAERTESSPHNLSPPESPTTKSMKKTNLHMILSGIILLGAPYGGHRQDTDKEVVELEAYEVEGFKAGLAKAMQEQRITISVDGKLRTMIEVGKLSVLQSPKR